MASPAFGPPFVAGEGQSAADTVLTSVRRHVAGPHRIGLFFLVVLTAIASMHFAIQTGLRRLETSPFGEFNRIVDGKINAAVLITGSSRAINHFDSREIARQTGVNTWNIGVHGSQTDMQLAVLRTYLQHNKAPRLLIHNLDSFAFVTSKDGLFAPEMYVPYLGERPIYDTLRAVDPGWWKARYLPLYGYAVDNMRFTWLLGLRALFGWNPPDFRVAGFEPRFTAWAEDFERFKRANPNGVTFQIYPEAVRDLEQLISAATMQGSRVLLVYSPVYYEMQTLERGRAALFNRFRQIAERSGAELWDYSDSPISRRRELFYNSQHLNAHGAALFSSDLALRLASQLARRDMPRAAHVH